MPDGFRILVGVTDLQRQVGQRIRELREAHGLTQEGLGERASLSYKFIGEIERGSANPTIDTLSRLASALGVTVSDLVRDDGSSPATRTLTPGDYQMVREMRDSLEALLKRFPVKPQRRGKHR